MDFKWLDVNDEIQVGDYLEVRLKTNNPSDIPMYALVGRYDIQMDEQGVVKPFHSGVVQYVFKKDTPIDAIEPSLIAKYFCCNSGSNSYSRHRKNLTMALRHTDVVVLSGDTGTENTVFNKDRKYKYSWFCDERVDGVNGNVYAVCEYYRGIDESKSKQENKELIF